MPLDSGLYDSLARALAPKMREAGFRGSRTRFTYPCGDDYATVTLQKDRYPPEEGTLSLTVNISYIRADDWVAAKVEDPSLPKKPGGAMYFIDGWYARLGEAAGMRGDKWWTVRNIEDVEKVAVEISQLARQHVVPEFERQARRDPRARPLAQPD